MFAEKQLDWIYSVLPSLHLYFLIKLFFHQTPDDVEEAKDEGETKTEEEEEEKESKTSN